MLSKCWQNTPLAVRTQNTAKESIYVSRNNSGTEEHRESRFAYLLFLRFLCTLLSSSLYRSSFQLILSFSCLLIYTIPSSPFLITFQFTSFLHSSIFVTSSSYSSPYIPSSGNLPSLPFTTCISLSLRGRSSKPHQATGALTALLLCKHNILLSPLQFNRRRRKRGKRRRGSRRRKIGREAERRSK
jgi:hypothetical protein